MRTFSYYVDETGVFTGDRVTISDGGAPPTPLPDSGLSVLEGAYDRVNERYDKATDRVVTWRAPPPRSTDYREWVYDEDRHDYVPQETPLATREREAREAEAVAVELERAAIPDMLELIDALLTPGGKPEPATVTRLKERRAQIAELRKRPAGTE